MEVGMMLATDDLRTLVIRDTLKLLDDWSPAAENLLIGTAAQESGLGNCLKSGRLLGLYHISPQAHQAVWDKYLVNHPDLASRIRGLAGQRSFLTNPHGELATNLIYATAIAWLIYKRCDIKLPLENDITGLAKIWHRHFHSKAAATVDEFVETYKQLAVTENAESLAA